MNGDEPRSGGVGIELNTAEAEGTECGEPEGEKEMRNSCASAAALSAKRSELLRDSCMYLSRGKDKDRYKNNPAMAHLFACTQTKNPA
jgi:hypothetical protein